jgi:hypothetical protein
LISSFSSLITTPLISRKSSPSSGFASLKNIIPFFLDFKIGAYLLGVYSTYFLYLSRTLDGLF